MNIKKVPFTNGTDNDIKGYVDLTDALKNLTDDDEGIESCMNCGKYFQQQENEVLCPKCPNLY